MHTVLHEEYLDVTKFEGKNLFYLVLQDRYGYSNLQSRLKTNFLCSNCKYIEKIELLNFLTLDLKPSFFSNSPNWIKLACCTSL